MTSLSFRDADGRELAPNGGLDPAQGGWHFVRWSAGEPDQVQHHWDAPGSATIQYTPSMQLDTPCRFPLAAVADWCRFRAHSMAEFIYCWWGTPHYNYLDLGPAELQRIIADTRRCAAGQAGAASEVALVMPRMPLYGVLDEPANDWADFMGWYKVLRHVNYVPDVYALEELSRPDLLTHRIIVVPDCAYIEPADAQRLVQAAQAGVRVVSSGRFATRDLSGRPQATPPQPSWYRRFAVPLGAQLLGPTYRQLTPTDTPPRLVCRPGHPDWQLPEATAAISAVQCSGEVSGER